MTIHPRSLLVLSQTMFLKAIRGFISVSRRRELSTLLEFFNLVQHENQWRNSQFYYLRQNHIDELLKGNDVLKERLTPFEELAAEIHPTLKLDAALTQLKDDFKRLEEIASKYEFVPIEDGIKQTVIDTLKPLAALFKSKGYLVQVTNETWVNAATQKYAAQLADLLKVSGFDVEGPKHITYYLIQASAPIELGYSPGMLPDVSRLFEALLPIFSSTERWTKREFPKTENTFRIHFGGSAVFGKNGIVTVE